MLIILSTLKAPFKFFRKIWSFGGSKFFGGPKNIHLKHLKPIILMVLPRKIEKYAQNMCKYAEIWGGGIECATKEEVGRAHLSFWGRANDLL